METPIGYIFTILVQSAESFLVIYIWTCAVSFPFIHCVFMIACCTDLKTELSMLNDNIEIENNREKKLQAKAITEIKEKFCEIIQFHCDAKQLSEDMFHST